MKHRLKKQELEVYSLRRLITSALKIWDDNGQGSVRAQILEADTYIFR